MDKGEKGFIFTFDSTLALLVTAIILTGIGQVGAREMMEGDYAQVQMRNYTDDAFRVLDRGGYLGEALDAIEDPENYPEAKEVIENGLEEAVPEDLIYEFDVLEHPIKVSSEEGIEWENKKHVTSTFLSDLPPVENHIRILAMAPHGEVTFIEDIKEERPSWGIKSIEGTEEIDYDEYTATNEEHVEEGRAFYDYHVFWYNYYAEGSEEYLGSDGDEETTLVELYDGYYRDKEEFEPGEPPKKEVFFETLEKEWEDLDVVLIPGANPDIDYTFNEDQRELLKDFAENNRLVLGGEPLYQNQEHDDFVETFGIEHPEGIDIEKEPAHEVHPIYDWEYNTEFGMYVRPLRIWPAPDTYLHPVIDGFKPNHLLHYPMDELVYFYDDYGDTVSTDPDQEFVDLIPSGGSDYHKDVTGGTDDKYYNEDTAKILTQWGRAPDGQTHDLTGLIVNDPDETEGSAVYIPANFVEASRYGEGSDYEWLRLAMNAISGEGLEFSSEEIQITIGIPEEG